MLFLVGASLAQDPMEDLVVALEFKAEALELSDRGDAAAADVGEVAIAMLRDVQSQLADDPHTPARLHWQVGLHLAEARCVLGDVDEGTADLEALPDLDLGAELQTRLKGVQARCGVDEVDDVLGALATADSSPVPADQGDLPAGGDPAPASSPDVTTARPQSSPPAVPAESPTAPLPDERLVPRGQNARILGAATAMASGTVLARALGAEIELRTATPAERQALRTKANRMWVATGALVGVGGSVWVVGTVRQEEATVAVSVRW